MPVQETNIGWTDLSANHWVGCAKVSEGCANCWAAGMADRFDRTPEPWTVDNIDVNLQPYDEDINGMLAKRDPAWCFYPSSSDPFLPWLSATTRHEYWQSVVENDHICFQVLTKWGPEDDRASQESADGEVGVLPTDYEPRKTVGENLLPDHVMLGVTVESQLRTYRLDWLREQPAQTRFVSFEPLLEPVVPDLTGIDWAIIGGESGDNRREWNPWWARELVRSCWEQDTAVFFKQHGDRYPEKRTRLDVGGGPTEIHEFPDVPGAAEPVPVKDQ